MTSGQSADNSKGKVKDSKTKNNKSKDNKQSKSKSKEKNSKNKTKSSSKQSKSKPKQSRYKARTKKASVQITENSKGEKISPNDLRSIKNHKVAWYDQKEKHGCVIHVLGYERQPGDPNDVDESDPISKNSYHPPTQTILVRPQVTGKKRKEADSADEPPKKKQKLIRDERSDERSDEMSDESGDEHMERKNENQKEEVIKSQYRQERDEKHCLAALKSNSVCSTSSTLKLKHTHYTIEGLVLKKPIQLTHRHHIRLKTQALQQRCITESQKSGAYYARIDLVYDFNGKTNVNGSFGLVHNNKKYTYPDQQLWSKKMDGNHTTKRYHGSCHEHVLTIYREYLSGGDSTYTTYADHLIEHGLGTMEYYYANVCTQLPPLGVINANGYNHIIANFNAGLLQCVDYLLCSLLCIEKNAFHNFDKSKSKLQESDYHYTMNCHLRDNIAVANGGYEIKCQIGKTASPQEELTLVKRVGLCKFGLFVSFVSFVSFVLCKDIMLTSRLFCLFVCFVCSFVLLFVCFVVRLFVCLFVCFFCARI